jgi:hypothetical protein
VFVGLQVLDLSLVNITAKNLGLIPAIYAASAGPVLLGLLLLLVQPSPRLFGRRGRRTLPADA